MSKNCGAGKISNCKKEDFPDRLYLPLEEETCGADKTPALVAPTGGHARRLASLLMQRRLRRKNGTPTARRPYHLSSMGAAAPARALEVPFVPKGSARRSGPKPQSRSAVCEDHANSNALSRGSALRKPKVGHARPLASQVSAAKRRLRIGKIMDSKIICFGICAVGGSRGLGGSGV